MAPSNTLIVKEIDSDLILYHPDRDEVHILNPTAQVIYKLLSDGKSFSEIGEELRSRFLLEDGYNILSDIEKCAQLLKKNGPYSSRSMSLLPSLNNAQDCLSLFHDEARTRNRDN